MESFGATHDYPVSLERVFAIFGQEEFHQQKFAALGDQRIEILECAADDEGALRIRTRREIPLKLPRVAQKVLGSVNRVLSEAVWMPASAQGERLGHWSIEAVGRPVELSGTMCLAPREGGCVNRITGQIAVKVRLVGGVVAKLLVKDATRALEKEFAFTRDYLLR